MQLQALSNRSTAIAIGGWSLERSIADASAATSRPRCRRRPSRPATRRVGRRGRSISSKGAQAELRGAGAAAQARAPRRHRPRSGSSRELEREGAAGSAGGPAGERAAEQAVNGAQAAPPDPRDVRFQAEIEKLDRQIATKEAEGRACGSDLADYQRRVEAVPDARIGAGRSDARLRDAAEELHSLLAKKEESKISANLERRQVGEQFKILDPARLPERPFSPNRLRITLIGARSALVLGVRARRRLLEYRDTTLRAKRTSCVRSRCRCSATIPMMRAERDRRAGGGAFWRSSAATAAGHGGSPVVVASGDCSR